jgi:hypothetical protein
LRSKGPKVGRNYLITSSSVKTDYLSRKKTSPENTNEYQPNDQVFNKIKIVGVPMAGMGPKRRVAFHPGFKFKYGSWI